MAETFATDAAWKAVKIGGGGMVTGIDVNADGTMVCRTDGAGAYIWNGTSWTQLVTAYTMPADFQKAEGVYEIRIAPSNSNILYMEVAGSVFKSIDKGAHWTKTGFPDVFMDANGDRRADGQKMAIDPTNPNVVFVGTQKDGLWVTRDGGATWNKITAVPSTATTSDAGPSGIVIHGTTVFVGTDGSGVYRSDDGGVTWRATGGPADVSHAVSAPNGDLFATNVTDQTLWKYSNGAWSKLPVDQVAQVAINPFDPLNLIVTTWGGSLQQTIDGGATWQGWAWGSRLEATDVPWLAKSGNYMSSSAIVFDPLVQGKLYQAAGVGVWNTTLNKTLWEDATGKYTDVVWHSQTAGIENIVSNDIIAPAGGDPIFASWDRAFFTESNLDDYATGYSGGDFSMGWSVDYASTNSSFIVGVSDWFGKENSGFSTDGGHTWKKFEGYPDWANDTVGGSIAASTPENFIWVTTGGKPPAYTLDGGKTWNNVSIPGVTDWTNLHINYYFKRTVITADRVEPNKFYLFDVNSGVYATSDGGVSWTKVFSGQPSPWAYWNSKIEAVPGSAGELFFTTGRLQGTGDISFMHSSDGGASWQAVNGVTEVTSFGFGAPKVAGGPATVFIIGFVNMDYGVWYSTDDAKTWTKIGEHPMGNLDSLSVISGDMDQFGRVYVGFGGNSYAYYDVDGSTPTPPTPPAPPPPPAPAGPPTQTALITSALDDVGASVTVNNGAVINDGTPTLSGQLSAALLSGQKLAVYRDSELIGQAAATNTSWTFTDPAASDGKHDYVVKVVDSLGQAGAASGSFSLVIDTVAPNQAVVVVAADLSSSTGLKTASLSASSSGSTLVTGNITGTLAADETVVVFRDSVKVGTAVVSNGSWSFNDAVTSGTFKYTAQVQDAAGNIGQMSSVLAVTLGTSLVEGTTRNDVLIGGGGADVLVGVGLTGKSLGKGTIDVLTGGAGNDIFVLGDSRGRFYDDGNSKSSGSNDYARITDFDTGDKVQLKGSAAEYLQGWIHNLQGASGTGIYHDTNGNGQIDSRDELIALVQNHGSLDSGDFIFV